MKGTTIECPRCKRPISVPRPEFGKSLPCPVCGWSIAILHPQIPPPADVILEQQDDVLVDYHDRLVELYERTTPLIEAVRARRSVAEAAIRDALDSEWRRMLCLVESARTQMNAIVNAAEQAARRVKSAARFPNKLHCPHCRRTVRYKDRAAGRSLRCPNPLCGRPITIPSLSERFWQAVNYVEGGELK